MADAGGIQLVSNLLNLPLRLEYGSRQAALERQLLRTNAAALGITPDQVDAIAPDPGLSAINPAMHPGTYGKILSGVGQAGNIISTLLGNPASPPRLELSTLTSLAGLRRQGDKQKALDTYAGGFKNPQAAAAARAGLGATAAKIEGGQTGKMGSELDALYQEGLDLHDGDTAQARRYALSEIDRRKTGRATAQASALAPIFGERDERRAGLAVQTQLKKDAAKKLTEIQNVSRVVFPLMDKAQAALTTSPLVAGSGAQRPVLWWKALAGDEGAAAVRQLPSQAARLARTVDVGNLSEQEQQVWHAFINGEDMTAQQFAVATNVLKRLLKSSATAYRHAYETGEPAPDELAPDDVGAAAGGGKGATPGGADPLDQLLRKHGK